MSPRVYRNLTQLENRLRGGSNIESIRDLEEQIREHERAIVKLKRTRNSLLNVSKLPPEILGEIFRWNVTVKDNFDGFEEGSYSFLLVCHHWFEVASRVPELWSFWGNNMRDWRKWHLRYPTAPLDLVLNGEEFWGETLDDTLREALQDRTTRDVIRRIHLSSGEPGILNSILSPLTASCEGIQSSSVESLILWDRSDQSVDVSDFFAHYRFPKLQCLELVNCTISSWDLMTSRTSVLTTLALGVTYPSPAPTTSELLSILASNPALRDVSLCENGLPDDNGGKSPFRVSLHNLRDLDLSGDLRHVFGFLHRLDLPKDMDSLTLNLMGCAVADISQLIGPYLRDYLRHRDKSQNGLGLYLFSEGYTTFHVGDVDGIVLSTPATTRIRTFIVITVWLDQRPKELLMGVPLELITQIPREEVVYLEVFGEPAAMEDVSAQLPNLRGLHFKKTPLLSIFPVSALDGDGKIFPSLRHIYLDHIPIRGGDWGPLMTFLYHRAISGDRLCSLVIDGSPRMHPWVEDRIRSTVQEFTMIGE